MAISETSLKDVALMTIESINKAGGVLGRKLEPVVVDPASNWPLSAEKARELLQKEKVAVTFGCWTSVSRKSVLPVFEELNGLLFYPSNTKVKSPLTTCLHGRRPNQQAIPAVEYLMSPKGGGAKRWVLLGTDYVYPRTTNKILRYFLHEKGVKDDDILEKYTPFGHSDYQTIVSEVKSSPPASRRRWSRPSTAIPTFPSTKSSPIKLEGDRHPRRRVLRRARKSCAASTRSPSSAIWLRGTTSCRSTTRSTSSSSRTWKAYVKEKSLPDGDKRVTNDPMEATVIGIKMWAQAVEQAGTTDVNAVRQAVAGQVVDSPSGFKIEMDMKNHHLHKPVYIAEVQADGQFKVVWKDEGPIRAMPWSPSCLTAKRRSLTGSTRGFAATARKRSSN